MKTAVDQTQVKEAIEQLRIECEDAAIKFDLWVETVENEGLEASRSYSWFHDHPIGSKGTRAIKLTKSKWRAEYTVTVKSEETVVTVTEIHPHDY